MTAERGLDTGDLNWLAQLGSLVRQAPAEHRDVAIRTLVDSSRRYRDRAGWPEIATASGVTEAELREWRGQYPPIPKQDHAIHISHRAPIDREFSATLLIITGHPNVRPDRTNDFTTETAMIRERCEHRFVVKEIAGIALHDIPHAVDEHLPVVLHLAAHSDHGEIFLTHNGEPVGITRSLLKAAFDRAGHKPAVVVLNFCGSLILAQPLSDAGHTTISWTSTVDDKQCREFNDVFYRMLAAGHGVGTSFDDAEITVSRWPDLLKPRLHGNRSMRA
jgi:hypothetical protein